MNNTNTAVAVGDVVRYARPESGEAHLTFTIIEDRGDRLLIESRDFAGYRFAPTEVVAREDVVLV